MRKLVALCSAALIAGGLLAACGGSSGSSKASSDNPGTSNTSGNTTGASGGGSSDAFSQLVANADKQKFKITYTTGSSSDTQTYEQDGKGDSVYGSGDSKYFTTPNSSISCTTGSDGKASCTQVPSAGGAVASPFLGLFNLGKTYIDALGGHGDTSSKTIAGRDARCVTFSAKDLGGIGGAAASALGTKGSATYCVDRSTGVLLEISGTDNSGAATSGFEVTKYEEPSDSDFTPPVTPSTISLPAGITLPSIPNAG